MGFAPAVRDFSAAVEGADTSDAANAMDGLPAPIAIRGAPAAARRNTRRDSIVIPSLVGGPNTSGASIL
jgi:hypothetical protein